MHRAASDAQFGPYGAHAYALFGKRLDLLRAGPNGRLPALVAALGLGLRDALTLPLQHHLPFELSHASEDVEHQLAGGRRGIYALVQDAWGTPWP